MDERRAINRATISDRGGAAACTGLQKPLAGLAEQQGRDGGGFGQA